MCSLDQNGPKWISWVMGLFDEPQYAPPVMTAGLSVYASAGCSALYQGQTDIYGFPAVSPCKLAGDVNICRQLAGR